MTASKRLGLEHLEERLALDATSFVQGLYRDVLHRAGGEGEVVGHVGALAAGAPREAVARAFLESVERRSLEIDRVYDEVLRRGADDSGIASNVDGLSRGDSLRDVAERLLTSAEYAASHPDDSSFIRGVFEDVLHRPANDGDLSIWLGNAARGGRSLVADGLLDSVERGKIVAAGLYFEFLSRDGSESETEGHARGALGGRFEDLARSFVLSAEFEDRVTREISGGGPVTTAIDSDFVNLAVGQQQTFQAGAAGSVTVVRTAAGVGLVSTAPAAGFRVEVENDEPNQVDLNFRNGGVRIDFDAELEDGLVRVRVRTRAG